MCLFRGVSTWSISHIQLSSNVWLVEWCHCNQRILIRWLLCRREDGVTCAYIDIVDIAQVVPFIVVANEMHFVGVDVGGIVVYVCGAPGPVVGRVVDQVEMIVDDSQWWWRWRWHPLWLLPTCKQSRIEITITHKINNFQFFISKEYFLSSGKLKALVQVPGKKYTLEWLDMNK